MPNSKSAKKNLLTNEKRRLRNRARKSRMKTFERKLLEDVSSKNAEGAKADLSSCFAELDRAAKAGTIHKNKANRKKARLTAMVAKLEG